jgi:hypothetical protein
MDVQPPAPIHTAQAETQPAIDALRRLAGTRDAFARLLENPLMLGEATARDAQQVLRGLPAFWSATGPGSDEARRLVLARVLIDVMKEEATLRGLDGTLGERATSLATRVAASGVASLPAGVHARELILGEVAHAGSLIATDDAQPDLALLFTAHGGWEAFDSLDRLLDTTRRRLIESVDAIDASGMDSDTFAEAKVRGGIGSREIAAGVFTTLADRMIEVQASRIALALDDNELDRDDPDAATRLADRVRYELSSAALLDIDGIESLREARLVEGAVAGRLADVPENVRTAWHAARDRYNDTLAAAAMLRARAGIQPPLSLHAFASRELGTRLKALGITESPEEITVDIARPRILPDLLAPLDPLPGSSAPRRVSLIDLACQNVGRFSVETLDAMTPNGMSLRDRLGSTALADLVRELDIASRYQAHLERYLRQGPTGALARKLAMAVQAAQMRLEAADARLSHYLPNEPRSFIDDRDERGFRWVEAALGTPTGERHVDRHAIAVSQITYRKTALDGILLFATRAPESAPRVILYTPNAPDGQAFREFASRQEAAKRFFYHPAFREYLLDRLPAEFAHISTNGATRTFAGDRLAHWVLGASGDAAYTRTAEPFDEREVRGDFLAAAYDATVEKQRRDTRFLARSTANADGDALLDYLSGRFNADPATTLAATVLADLPASLGRMTRASWRFYDHVKAGDSGEAFVAFTEGYVNALNVVVPPFVHGRRIAAAIVRSTSASGGVVSTGVRLTPPGARFDERYAMRNLGSVGAPGPDGVFRIRGQSFIEQDGTHFLVHHDADYALWRLAPAQGALDAHFTGPLIERVDGRWIYAHDAGLRGGMRRGRLAQVIRAPSDPGWRPPGSAPAHGTPEPVADVFMVDPHEMPLPAGLEHLRAEFDAARAANPSAVSWARADGTYVQTYVPQRSALILDPLLHPDIASLSAHQRRVFLHEIDTRFPLAAERAEALDIGAWARDHGRRVPSPPPNGVGGDPGRQSPTISSSTGDPVPAVPTLAPHQQARWNEALAVARNAPRTASQAGPSNAALSIEALSPAEVVPRDNWPGRVWVFSDREFQLGPNDTGVSLGGDFSSWFRLSQGIRSYPVSVLPPETPTNVLSEVIGVMPGQQAAGRDPLAHWMQIDLLARRRDLQPGYEMRRRLLPSGEYQYMLTTNTLFLPHIERDLISGSGRRTASGLERAPHLP